MKIRKRFLNALCLLSNLFKWTKSIPRQSQPVPPHRVLIASLFRTSSYRVIERARGFTRLYEVVLSHHTERYRIPSNRINQRGGERGGRNSKCRHEGLDRGTGEPRTTQSGRGYSWKSSFFVIEEGEKERERGRKKKRNRRGYSWDPSDSPISTGSLRSEEGGEILWMRKCANCKERFEGRPEFGESWGARWTIRGAAEEKDEQKAIRAMTNHKLIDGN